MRCHIHDPELCALCKALLHSGTISDFSAQMHIDEIYVETSLPKLIFFRVQFFAVAVDGKWESSHAAIYRNRKESSFNQIITSQN